MQIMDRAEHVKKVQELYEQLAAVHKELADALSMQSIYKDYWMEEAEKKQEVKR